MTLQGLRSRSPIARCVAPGSSQTDSAAAQARAPRVPRPRDEQARPGDTAQVAGVLEDADLDLRVETAPGVVVVLRRLFAMRLRRLAHRPSTSSDATPGLCGLAGQPPERAQLKIIDSSW